jgi:hypothetical protein
MNGIVVGQDFQIGNDLAFPERFENAIIAHVDDRRSYFALTHGQ